MENGNNEWAKITLITAPWKSPDRQPLCILMWQALPSRLPLFSVLKSQAHSCKHRERFKTAVRSVSTSSIKHSAIQYKYRSDAIHYLPIPIKWVFPQLASWTKCQWNSYNWTHELPVHIFNVEAEQGPLVIQILRCRCINSAKSRGAAKTGKVHYKATREKLS